MRELTLIHDLCRLLVGSLGTLGLLAEVVLRCQPGQAGDLHKQLIIHTDLDQSATATVSVEAKVQP